MLPLDEAQAKVVANAVRVGEETVDLVSAAGRVLAEDLRAMHDIPPFDGSTMDGYAVKCDEFSGDGPWEFDVVHEATPGAMPPPRVRNSVMRIFTGAHMPEGADAIVMQEEVTIDPTSKRARFSNRPRVGTFIRPQAHDIEGGEIAISRGTRLNSAKIALAAALDRAELRVSKSPRVAILALGDELCAPGTSEEPASIPDCNSVAIALLSQRAGAALVLSERVRDDRNATDDAVARALECADLVVTIGGASVGAHDHARASFEACGASLEFWKVAVKPGKPIAFGKRGNTMALAIPGNPASAMITFALFGVPLLRAMQGDRAPLPTTVRARLGMSINREKGRTEFLRATLVRDAAKLTVIPLTRAHQTSGSALGVARADALIRIPADVASIRANSYVDIFLASEIFP